MQRKIDGKFIILNTFSFNDVTHQIAICRIYYVFDTAKQNFLNSKGNHLSKFFVYFEVTHLIAT